MANILVIDDDNVFREMIVTYLKEKGHEVQDLPDGSGLTATLGKNIFDLVITDLVMPEKEGFEVITELSKNHPKMKILAVSAGFFGETMNSLETAELLGATTSLRKPFDLKDLEQKLVDLGV